MSVVLAKPENLIKVAPGSSSQAVANSIVKCIFDHDDMPVLRAIGAGAVSQAVKAIAIARGIVAVRGIDLSVNMGFESLPDEREGAAEGDTISSMVFMTFLR